MSNLHPRFAWLKTIGLYLPVSSLALSAVLFAIPTQVGAQELDEIVVTARKREESLQDVPLSVLTISGSYIEENGITDFQQLAPYTPNFSYSQTTGASDILIMRGLGSIGSGPHFEQAVGQVWNGFFVSRSRLGRTGLIDLQQIEVLRGPQGAIIGKNTSLGAINMTPRKPTDEFEFSLMGGFDFEASEGFEIQGILSGPMSDRFRGRLVVNFQDRDGWVENRSLGTDVQQREDLTTRLILEADLSDNVSAEFFFQNSDFDRLGKHREVYECIDPVGAAAVGFDCTINASDQSVVIVNGVDIGEPYTMDSDMFGLTVNWDIGGATITSLTGFAEYNIFDQFDSDQRPIERRRIFNDEDYEQFTQELRITSSGDRSVDYIAGIFYLTSEMDFIQASDFDPAPGPPGTPSVRRMESAHSETDTIAGFAQFDWHLNDQWDLTVGGRWTSEERDGIKSQTMNDIHTFNENTALCGGGFRACTRGNDGTGAPGDPIFGNIDDSNFSWNVSLQWSPTDASMYYVLAATGFKSGGFDLRGAGDPSTFIFNEEETTNFEIGGKHNFDGRVRFNWTLYHTDIDGLQQSSNDPITVTQFVTNSDATGQGLEIDLGWAATEAFTLGLAAAFADTEYDKFLGACYWQQTPALGCDTTTSTQDQTGQRLPYAPKTSVVASGEYTWNNVFGANSLSLMAKVINVGDQEMQIDNNPLARQDSYTKVDASITLRGADDRWRIALIGRNLTDEIVYHYSAGTTACPGSVGGSTSCLFTTVEETRAVALRGQINF